MQSKKETFLIKVHFFYEKVAVSKKPPFFFNKKGE
jgi:hypothetical protein